MKLNLGFEDFPYPARYDAGSPLSASVRKRRPKLLSRPQQTYGQGKTTGQIAAELERRYNIVDTFYAIEEDYIIDLIEEQALMDIDAVMTMEEPSRKGMSFSETDKIERKFRDNLAKRRYDGIIQGVPTLASLRGVSHLKKRPYAKSNASRPSFVDTGLYASSFRAWMEE